MLVPIDFLGQLYVLVKFVFGQNLFWVKICFRSKFVFGQKFGQENFWVNFFVINYIWSTKLCDQKIFEVKFFLG